MRIKLSVEAAEEMLDSASWYDKREPGLGMNFWKPVITLLNTPPRIRNGTSMWEMDFTDT